MRRVAQLARWVWASPGTLIGLTIGLAGLLTGGSVQAVRGALEFHGGLVDWMLRKPARGSAAMTLGHVILGRSPELLESARDHEHVHVRQYERWGPFFLPAYGCCAAWLWLRGRHGYWDNPFEREAYDHCATMTSDSCDPESPA
jgi:hypothetical protein